MSRIIIAGGTVFTGGSNAAESATVVVDSDTGCIEFVGDPNADEAATKSDDNVVDATGLWVGPGLIDLHVSVPDPGYEHRETLESASQAGSLGGYTTLYTLPDTSPSMDSGPLVRAAIDRAASCGSAGARLVPHGVATVGLESLELAPYGDLSAAGCSAIVCGKFPIASAGLMRRILEYASAFDLLVVVTPVEQELGDGVCDEGVFSTRFGLPSSPAIAERLAIERDAALAALTGAQVHFARVSTQEGVDAIGRAKSQGAPVSCSVTPHHLHLTAASLASYDPAFKVWPPLRTATDVLALRQGLADGTIDAVTADHTPLHAEDKRREFISAPAGISGIETSLGLLLELVADKTISASRMFELMSSAPARIAGGTQEAAHGGLLAPGEPADIVLVSPAESWLVDPSVFRSLGKNTPFKGRVMAGRAVATMRHGAWTHRNAQDGPA